MTVPRCAAAERPPARAERMDAAGGRAHGPALFRARLAADDRRRRARRSWWRSRRSGGPFVIVSASGLRHPDAYIDTFGRWAIHPAHVRNPWAGLLAATKWDVMARRTSDFWTYVSPTFLFDGQSLFNVGMLGFVAAGCGRRWMPAVGRRRWPLASCGAAGGGAARRAARRQPGADDGAAWRARRGARRRVDARAARRPSGCLVLMAIVFASGATWPARSDSARRRDGALASSGTG